MNRSVMVVIQTPFFLLFCITSAVGAYLAHRLIVREAQPAFQDRLLAVIAGILSVALSVLSYSMRAGTYRPARIDPTAAGVIAAFTGLGIAFLCIKCVLPDEESVE